MSDMSIYEEYHDDYAEVIMKEFNLKKITRRFGELKLLQIELDTTQRLEDKGHLELKMKHELDQFQSLQQEVDAYRKDREKREQKMIKHTRDAAYYRQKIQENVHNAQDLDSKVLNYDRLKSFHQDLKNELDDLEKAMKKFEGLEPTNESLRKRIEELKSSRISLGDLTFVDND